jgi:hypothetical protein
MKLKIALILSILFQKHILFSQSIDVNQTITNSKYVFQAVVLDYALVKGQDEKLFVSYLLKVTKNLKENSEKIKSNDTVEVLSIAPEIGA